MSKSLRSIIYIVTVSFASYSQNANNDLTKATTKPTIGIGTGMFSFYGDLYKQNFQNPAVGRMAFDLQVSKYVQPSLQISLYTLFGKLGANERLPNNTRNLNFESQIRLGGLSFLYNFDHILPKNRVITPYISTGIESFEFLSKTDLKDKNGNTYHYWSDGSIRNKDQADPSAGSAVILQRDYTYETDIRDLDLDGFGKYKEQSFAIPLGIGVIMHLTDKCDLKIGTTIHQTFTDYIDGVSGKSIGNRKGNDSKDRFVMTSFSLNFVLPTREENKDSIYEETTTGDEMLAYDIDDADHDGVIDIKDSCQGTPDGVTVDKKGCPFDDDNDGVPNYRDKEQNSPKNAFVNSEGVQLNDSLILLQYLTYMDTTGQYAKIEVREDHGSSGLSRPRKVYTVQLGVFQNGISPQLMTKFLSIKDVSSTFINDTTAVYTSGTFNNYQDAENRKKQLVSDGLTDAKVVYKQGGKFVEAPDITKDKNAKPGTPVVKENTVDKKITEVSNAPASTGEKGKVIFRVQLGAYGKKLSSSSVFPEMQNLIEIKEEGGLYKYLAGSFNTMEDAAKYRVELLTQGYENTIIAAYKDGQRVPLSSVGATMVNKKEKEVVVEPTAPVSAIKKNMIVFKVQVGIFKNEPPFDMQYKFKGIANLHMEKTTTGLTRYVAGSFSNYKSALVVKNEIAENNDIPGAFVVAKFNNEYIPLQEALELLK